VRDAAILFRTILEAMSHPGKILSLPVLPEAPRPLNSGTVAAALTLLDGGTFVWLESDFDIKRVRQHLSFHCSSSIVDLEKAQFAVLEAKSLASIAPGLSKGTPDYPDRSATAIVQVDGFDGDKSVTLSGPGIETITRFSPRGFDLATWKALILNSELYPLGFDTLFTSDRAIAALPRSTRISLQEY
jgi:alpha-D-ribose 1-methylphosphonate 5-triphosphate synthase subunit PhnH